MLRNLLVVATLILIATVAIVSWWQYPRLTRVAKVDRVAITRLSVDGKKGRQWNVTDAKDLTLLKDAVMGSERVILEAKCQQPEYHIDMYCGDELILFARPTPCCGMFRVNGILYQDRDRQLRAAIASIAVE